MSAAIVMPRPGNRAIRVGDDGRPWIEGYRCGACGAVVAEQTLGCRACASREPPEPFHATDRGTLHTWSVVYRSFPGIDVPFVSAIVDLDDGVTLKGTLKVDPAALREHMPVRLVFDDAGGARDKDGVPYAGFHFIAAGEAQ